MGDMGDIFRDMAEYKKVKRKDNTEKSTKLLQIKGIPFESKNNGAHLIVKNYNFWPSTGLFQNRDNSKKGRGIFNLIKNLDKEK